jgi:thiol-disulfide isomerase/thioredoxin
MKYLSLVVFIITSLIATAQQKIKDRFILDGKVLNHQDGFVYLSYADKDGKSIRDSTALKNGTFRFTGFITQPTMGSFYGKLISRSSEDPNYTNIFLEPGNLKITVSVNNFKNAKVTGSKTQDEYEVLQKPLRKIRDRWKVVMDTLSAANKRSNFEYQELKDWVLQPYNSEVREVELAFINTHPFSYVTAFTLRVFGRELTTDSLRLFYTRFPEKVKQSTYGKIVASDLEKRKIGIPGTPANNFSAIDINGNKVSLSDFKGKYILLDFWASWCVPCRKLNPHLKELYTRYKEKGFEVIGVSDDDRNHEAWKKAVAQDGLPWQHVLRGFKMVNGVPDRSADINEGYNISTLPTHILVDRTGKIIARYGEDGEDHSLLDQKLKSVFE